MTSFAAWLQSLGPPDLSAHRAHPEVSVEAYADAKSRQVAAAMEGKKLIYLDTKFWVLLCDASLGRPKSPSVTALLASLRSAKQAGKILCPFAADIFTEVLKQKDPVTRRATAQLIDELSGGVTLRAELDRVDLEFEDLFTRLICQRSALTPLRDLVWSAPGYVVGERFPFHGEIDPQTMLALQKAFLDVLWRVTFTQLVDMLPEDAVAPRSGIVELAAQLNANHAKYAHEITSAEQAAAIELYGYLELHASAFRKMLLRRFRELPILAQESPTPAQLEEGAARLMNLIVHIFRQGKLIGYLPTAVIQATLYGALRWNKARNYKPNDFHDFGHAAAALPYHHIFATERSLAHLLHEAKLDHAYGVTVVTEADELTAILRQL